MKKKSTVQYPLVSTIDTLLPDDFLTRNLFITGSSCKTRYTRLSLPIIGKVIEKQPNRGILLLDIRARDLENTLAAIVKAGKKLKDVVVLQGSGEIDLLEFSKPESSSVLHALETDADKVLASSGSFLTVPISGTKVTSRVLADRSLSGADYLAMTTVRHNVLGQTIKWLGWQERTPGILTNLKDTSQTCQVPDQVVFRGSKRIQGTCWNLVPPVPALEASGQLLQAVNSVLPAALDGAQLTSLTAHLAMFIELVRLVDGVNCTVPKLLQAISHQATKAKLLGQLKSLLRTVQIQKGSESRILSMRGVLSYLEPFANVQPCEDAKAQKLMLLLASLLTNPETAGMLSAESTQNIAQELIQNKIVIQISEEDFTGKTIAASIKQAVLRELAVPIHIYTRHFTTWDRQILELLDATYILDMQSLDDLDIAAQKLFSFQLCGRTLAAANFSQIKKLPDIASLDHNTFAIINQGGYTKNIQLPKETDNSSTDFRYQWAVMHGERILLNQPEVKPEEMEEFIGGDPEILGEDPEFVETQEELNPMETVTLADAEKFVNYFFPKQEWSNHRSSIYSMERLKTGAPVKPGFTQRPLAVFGHFGQPSTLANLESAANVLQQTLLSAKETPVTNDIIEALQHLPEGFPQTDDYMVGPELFPVLINNPSVVLSELEKALGQPKLSEQNSRQLATLLATLGWDGEYCRWSIPVLSKAIGTQQAFPVLGDALQQTFESLTSIRWGLDLRASGFLMDFERDMKPRWLRAANHPSIEYKLLQVFLKHKQSSADERLQVYADIVTKLTSNDNPTWFMTLLTKFPQLLGHIKQFNPELAYLVLTHIQPSDPIIVSRLEQALVTNALWTVQYLHDNPKADKGLLQSALKVCVNPIIKQWFNEYYAIKGV